MLDAAVLVLNRSYIPVAITTVRRAFCLLSKGHVRAMGPDFRPYTMEEWIDVEPDEQHIATPRRSLAIPRVVVLVTFDRLPQREVKFSRRNISLRDNQTCAYCGVRSRGDNMNLDHVIPVSRGGKSSWLNVVLSCYSCNSKKGDRTPEEAGMTLRRRPERPSWLSFMNRSILATAHESWRAYAPQLFGEPAASRMTQGRAQSV